MLRACDTVHRKTATFSAISTGTTSGRWPGSAPATVRQRRMPRLAARTQSTHWAPTDADCRHSGHAGRSHRVQVSAVARSGWRTHTAVGGAAGGPPYPPGPPNSGPP